MALDYRAAAEARNQGLIDKAVATIRDWTRRVLRQPGGLVTAVFEWDSGEDGTALVAAGTRRSPVLRVPFPAVLNRWDIMGYPSGSATVVVYMAAEGVALSGASAIATLTLSGEESSNSAIAEVTIPARARLFALLTAVATCQTLAANLEARRVPDDAD